MKSGKVALGMIMGMAVGALIGILFAPDKGSNTRKKIMDKNDDCVNALKEKLQDLTSCLTDKVENSNEKNTMQ
jgi:gas vesicle protein